MDREELKYLTQFKDSETRQDEKWNTMRFLGIGFLILILAGSVLLRLPISNALPTTYLDSLFTATSAVCVTGLVTVTPAVQYTLFGKFVLLVLIQVGGLGIVAVLSLFFLLLSRRITVKEQIVIQETYGINQLGGVLRLVKGVLAVTFSVEGAGAVGYAFVFVPKFGWLKGIWYSVFHAISAFCNAGIDILGDSSLCAYSENPVICIVTMLLIVLSGIGFVVWLDVLDTWGRIRKKEVPKRWFFTRLELHSKLAIVMTAILIAVGALAVFGLEYSNPDTIGSMSLGGKIMNSLFQSVTDRTAGFASFSQGAMRDETKFVNCLIMFVGGSPAGTAGGVKTTTIALVILSAFATVRGSEDVEIFGRRIPRDLLRTALTIILIGFSAIVVGTVAVLCFEPKTVSFIDVLYETTSAVATVGLSADLTAKLSAGSRIVIILLMYFGRLGPMTIALMFVGKNNKKDMLRKLPTDNIMVG